jgi:hypothetical protein
MGPTGAQYGTHWSTIWDPLEHNMGPTGAHVRVQGSHENGLVTIVKKLLQR